MFEGWQLGEPFAVALLYEHRKGKTVDDLVRETGISRDRIELRLHVAEMYLARRRARSSSGCAVCAGAVPQ